MFKDLLSEQTEISKLMTEAIQNIQKRREDQIIARLAELGHVFTNETEMQEFAKTRITLRLSPDKRRELYLDDTQLIASWWETIEIVGNQIISGNPPSKTSI